MGINMEDLPSAMSLSELAEHCLSEIHKYRQREPSNDQYCLEIFRRAMLHHDEHAWELLQQRFQAMMLAWLRRHPRREQALYLDSEENYVAQAFSRFWLTTVRHQELQFSTLAAALDYLRAALSSTIMDALRAQMRSRELPMPEPGYAGEPAQEDEEADDGLREIIKSLLPNPREQRVADLLFHCNLKPREILDRCPEEFSDVQEIYRLRRNIMDRLLRYRERLRWLLGDEE
jgi:hypothetical protein